MVFKPKGSYWAVAAVLLMLWSYQGPTGAEAGRILGFFYLPGRSHFVVFEPLLKELAARGHQVDVFSHFPQEKPLPNYTDFSVKGSWPSVVNAFTFDDLLNMHYFKLMSFHWTQTIEMCRKAMEHPVMKEIEQSKNRYDLVLVEVFGTDCAYGYAHKFGAPVIGLTSLIGLAYGQERVGNPDNPAYIPVANLPFTSHMNLWERILNTAGKLYAVLGEKYFGRWSTDDMLREFLGEDIPPLHQLVKNTSLVMVNSHFSINGARPAVPGYLEVGGMHIDPKPGKLPKDMQAFLDGAGPEGVVVVSLGSLLPFETMEPEKLKAFLKVLSSLPQRVIWRINGTRVSGGLPRNAFGHPWIPQNTVLSHPKTRAFISHGGLGGMQEAVYWGVPAIVIPFCTDQRQNGMLWRDKGAARILQYWDITEETVRENLDAVLNDPRYRENAKKFQEVFRDRPQTPMETAVFWTEYVMRHKGAPQLQSAAVDLAWYQLWLLDVAAVVATTAALLAAVFWLAVGAVWRWIWSSSKHRATVKTKPKIKAS